MLKLLKRKNIITLALNTVKDGDNYFFRNLFASDASSKERDILEDGRNSCAAFVSWILLTQELIRTPHVMVNGMEKDLISSGWYEIKEPRLGAVIMWEEKMGAYDKLMHRHVGFCINDSEAISNDSQGRGFPHKHHITYNGSRKIEKIYWHPELEDK